MPSDTRPPSPLEQAQAISEALRALRERAGMTQEAAAEAMGVTRQAWQQYETAGKPVLLRTDMQERLAEALGLGRDDLLRERDRQAGRSPAGRFEFQEEATKFYGLPVLGKVRSGESGPEIHDIAEPESVVDVSWMFGPSGRTLRQVGETMSGYVESGDLVVYDTSLWPRRNEGCVIELQSGEVLIREYLETSQGLLRVRQRSPEQNVTIPMSQVKGVYRIRFRGG